MKTRILSAITAASLVLTSFAALTITAGATDYTPGDLGEDSIGKVIHSGDRVDYNVLNTQHFRMVYRYDGKEEKAETTLEGRIEIPIIGTVISEGNLYVVEKKGDTYEYWKVTASERETISWNSYWRVVTVVPNDPTVTAPTANTLEWTGEAQELVTAGSAENGTMLYSVNGGEFSESIPTAADGGTYTVSYYVKGDKNFNDTAAKTLTVTISGQPATAEYRQEGEDIVTDTGNEKYDIASVWTVEVTPGSDAIESLDVKVNNKSSQEGAWTDSTKFTGGTVQFSVAVNLAAADVGSVTAVVNGADVVTTELK